MLLVSIKSFVLYLFQISSYLKYFIQNNLKNIKFINILQEHNFLENLIINLIYQ